MNDMTATDTSFGASPMMAQYLEIKAANPDSLLFYRMGDFYELFFNDAEAASRSLGIALTKRGKHRGEDIPMCGVPVHAADGYLQRLIKLGHRVAVCEQLEDPAEARRRGSKSVVRRDVVRLVTPGTLTEDTLLESKSHNYLAALSRVRGDEALALAWTDISSGEFAVQSTAPARLAADLARLQPSEIVVPDSLLADAAVSQILDDTGAAVTPLPAVRFDSASGERRIAQHFKIAALDAFGSFSRAEIAAMGGLLDYVLLTQTGRAPHLRPPVREKQDSTLLIDAATRANLELTRTLAGERQGSLLQSVDMTVSAAGARLLAQRLAAPLADPVAINTRLDAVAYFAAEEPVRAGLRPVLAAAPDLERALARLTVGRGGPRDLRAVLDCVSGAASLREPQGLTPLPAETAGQFGRLRAAPSGLLEALRSALADDLPMLARDGNVIRTGYSEDLDRNRQLRDDARQVIASLQARYAEQTGVKSLKVRFNNVLGYFIEVTAQNAVQLAGPDFIHRQTIANAVRFTTGELADLDRQIAAAGDRALAIELEIFNGLVEQVTAERGTLSDIAAAMAELDVVAAFAELAVQRRYARPRVDASLAFDVQDGRHPVVEAMLRERGDSAFIPNSCDLSSGGKRLWLLTGPNMAGKSTFLRQNALIVILAQIGSFVPAASAHIGAVDRLFSRVGAADDLARGRSTFMVEMVETAAILNQAGERSFVILDEIGRGTATFDGLSIAWAAVEHLNEVNRCRALFATHYHELTALAAKLPALANATVKVREWNGEVVFLHEVVPGVADRSYGIQVAKLAGLPAAVTDRATQVLQILESSEQSAAHRSLADELPLFAARPSAVAPPREPGKLERRFAEITPDELSPRDALALIYELKALLK